MSVGICILRIYRGRKSSNYLDIHLIHPFTVRQLIPVSEIIEKSYEAEGYDRYCDAYK